MNGFEESDPAPLESHGHRSVTLQVSELEQVLTRAVRRGINDAIRQATSDENIKRFWHSGFLEMHKHTVDTVRQGVGSAVIKWGSGVIAAAGLFLYLKFGPFK